MDEREPRADCVVKPTGNGERQTIVIDFQPFFFIVAENALGTQKGHVHKIFPNLLKQNFVAEEANQVWGIDFTYVFLTNGPVRYNCSALDLYDRSVAESGTGKWIKNDLAILALGAPFIEKETRKSNIVFQLAKPIYFRLTFI